MFNRFIIGLVVILIGTVLYQTHLHDQHPISSQDALEIASTNKTVQEWLAKNNVMGASDIIQTSNSSVSTEPITDVKDEENSFQVTFTPAQNEAAAIEVSIDKQNGQVQAVVPKERVIVLFKNAIQKEIITKYHGQIIDTTEGLPLITVILPSEYLDDLVKEESITSVEKDDIVTIQQQQIDWGMTKIQTPSAWNSNLTGKGIDIAVIDSGVANHPDLSIKGGASFVSYTDSYTDDNGHGTHVAGIIGATHNTIGTAGVASGANLFAVKVLNSTGSGYLSDILLGIDWAVQNKMDIINLSLGLDQPSTALEASVNNAYQKGIIVVAASGNSGSSANVDTVAYPAKYESVIAVGATDQANKIAPFSSTGNAVEVTAPGANILSTYLNNSTSTSSGTSMAAPHVSGILALIKEANPTASVEEIRKILQSNVIDLGNPGRDRFFGFGLVQASTSHSIHGQNRFETSIRISQTGWPNGSNTVYLSRGDLPIDALTGSVLASKTSSPILLTNTKSLNPEIKQEIIRLKPITLTLLGGEGALSKNVSDELTKLGYKVNRVAGINRYETGVRVANLITSNEVFITTGNYSPDALSIAPYAGLKQIPILYTPSKSLPAEVAKYIKDKKITKATLIGGEGVVSKGIEQQLKSLGVGTIERVGGLDRYATSTAIVKKYRTQFANTIFLASGRSFVDALPGAPLAVKYNAPIILVDRDTVPSSVSELLTNNYDANTSFNFLGGYGVISIQNRAVLEKKTE